ncbi:MAG: DUF3180 domain-containing protein [Actinomycetia bacterium]|nr:DUF3180 domain-containing protein [Actinomycetes bacterium]
MLRDGLKPAQLLSVLIGAGVLAALIWHFVTRTGRLLQAPSWLTVAVVLVLAALVLWSGWQVRAYQRGDLKKHFSPLRAARTLALAQASALTGAAIAGWFIGHLAILLPDRDLTPYARQIIPLLVVIGAAVVLTVAGLITQHWCRLPEDHDPPSTGATP